MNPIELKSEAGADRRNFLGLAGAAAVAGAAVILTGQEAGAQSAGNLALPNLYRNTNSRQFNAIRDHENEHVTFLVTALGAQARPKPNFKNLVANDLKTFGTISQALENTGVGAYLGATPVIFNKQFLAAAASIALIEARHAGYLNTLFNGVATNDVTGVEQVFEGPLTIQQVQNLAGPFIADLNGGAPLTFNTTPSRANDFAILNFALALEYLEAEFYNLNVPRFFPV